MTCKVSTTSSPENIRFLICKEYFQSCFLQAEGTRVDQAGVGAVAGGGEAGEEGRGAGQDDPGKDAHRGVGEVTFSNMTLSIFNK